MIVRGSIRPHDFGPGGASKALRALAESNGPSDAALASATRMANTAQALWDAVRDASPEELEALATVNPEISARLVAVRRAMTD